MSKEPIELENYMVQELPFEEFIGIYNYFRLFNKKINKSLFSLI